MAKVKDLKPLWTKPMELSFQAKLGSIVVHADELTSPGGHHFDAAAIRSLVEDPEVVEWLRKLQSLAMVPIKRVPAET